MLWPYGPSKRVLLDEELFPSTASHVANGATSKHDSFRLVPCTSGLCFALLTPISLSIWSAKPVRPLTLTVRSAQSLAQHGDSKDITWSPDTKWLAVRTSFDYLILYTLDFGTETLLTYIALSENIINSSISAGPNEGSTIQDRSIKFKAIIRVDLGIVALESNDLACIVACATGGVIQILPWSHVRDAYSTTLTQIQSREHVASLLSISRGVQNAENFFLVLEDGSVCRLSFTISAGQPDGQVRTRSDQLSLLGNRDDSHHVFNHLYGKVAFARGRQTLMFGSINSDHLITIDMLSKAWSRAEDINIISWSHTGLFLFCAGKSGWAILNLAGNVLSSEHVDDGVIICDAFMGTADATVYILTLDNNTRRFSCLLRSLVRSSLLACPTEENTKFKLLIAENELLYEKPFTTPPSKDYTSNQAGRWHHLPLPNEYIAHRWPVTLALCNSGCEQIAIAGVSGLAIWTSHSHTWMIFEDERMSPILHAIWHDDTLVIMVKAEKGYILKALEVARQSQTIETLSQIEIGTTAEHVALAPKRFYFVEKGNLLANDVSFDEVAGKGIHVGATVKLALQSEGPFTCHELSDGTTILYSSFSQLILRRPRQPDVELHEVDHCTVSDPVPGSSGRSIWLSRRGSVECWSAFDSQYVKLFSISMDFLPIGIDTRRGAVTGVSSELGTYRGAGKASRLQSKMHLYLPDISYWLLISYGIDTTYQYLTSYSELSYLTHSLEILLHRVLEGELICEANLSERASVLKRNEHLSKAIELIDRFPRCLEVVVACARKTEASVWRQLFEAAGSPKDLYNRCISASDLRTAGMYLLVLHTLESSEDTEAETCHLFKLAIRARDYELGKELLRFLTNVGCSEAAVRLVQAKV